MDLGGCGIDGERHVDAGPDQDHPAKFDVSLGWEPKEIAAFTDSFFKNGPKLPEISPMIIQDGSVIATFSSEVAIAKGYVVYTCDSGVWQERKWHIQPAEKLTENSVSNTIPDRCKVIYLAVEDGEGNFVSCPHTEIC